MGMGGRAELLCGYRGGSNSWGCVVGLSCSVRIGEALIPRAGATLGAFV